MPPPLTPPHSKQPMPHPWRFHKFLDLNRAPGSRMPLSYNPPAGYWDTVPPGLKRQDNDPDGTYIAACIDSKLSMDGKPKGTMNATLMNNYEFETERILATLGLDIYDGAVWTIAQSILGVTEDPLHYNKYVLWASRSLLLANLRGSGNTNPVGDAGFCKGNMFEGECTDPSQNGKCGLCYGDDNTAVPRENALLFRLIGDPYAIQGTKDERCPDLPRLWTWNDFKPIVGENAWASFLGPLTLGLKVYGTPDKIPEDSPEFQLGLMIIPALQALRSSATGDGKGSIYYCPHNSFFYKGSTNLNAGSTVSVENQASLLAALKAFDWVLAYHTKYSKVRCEVQEMMAGLESFIMSAWNGEYFRQGGTYNKTSQKWTWGMAGQPDFAVDCQTWVSTVIGPKKIDAAFGVNATWKLWETLKTKSGYGTFENGTVKGTGYSLKPAHAGLPSTDTREVSPEITVWVSTPHDEFNNDVWLDHMSFSLGVPPTSAHLLETVAWQGGTMISMVFVRVGDVTARQTAADFVNMCNTPTSQKARYVNATKAAFQEVFSGEWTLGAVNMLRVVAAESGYAEPMIDHLVTEADFMRRYVDVELLEMNTVQGAYDVHPGILYGSARYYVPFGWWSNPIQATSSTGWAVFADLGWNPLMINGQYAVDYPDAPAAGCSNPQPDPPATLPIPSAGDLPFDPTPHDVLSNLYQATTPGGWHVPSWWEDPFTYNPCGNVSKSGARYAYMNSWNGVGCDNDGRVVSLTLANNNLDGSIPDSIGFLTYLVSIDMRENKLSGKIPDSFGKLTRLEELQLSQNQLEGGVPASMGNLTRLKMLWLTDNKLTGSLPVELKNCPLQVLNVNNNQLTSLVDGLPWDTYQNCDLSGNPFKCPVPDKAQSDCYAFCS
eukprot:TRINITY_DN998_c1_g1_i1.p1 TRINITY_DN998_c1_g1~~TRINITY_DN998_c1_g1_i1.p1  ORF type:complete len:952 (+),score=280.30 TRINITY_DN998_c1_g1_i1:194-2857(+)